MVAARMREYLLRGGFFLHVKLAIPISVVGLEHPGARAG